jgi:putative PIN family toxin of toxin-antitoxin system
MRVVVDTNVFIGACMGTGACNAVIQACFEHRFNPVMGAALLTEYEDVLHREALFTHCKLDRTERETLLDIFLSLCDWTKVYYLWRPNLRDEADNHLIELAIASGADYVVTRNVRDFQSSQLLFPALRVITPENFLKELHP